MCPAIGGGRLRDKGWLAPTSDAAHRSSVNGLCTATCAPPAVDLGKLGPTTRITPCGSVPARSTSSVGTSSYPTGAVHCPRATRMCVPVRPNSATEERLRCTTKLRLASRVENRKEITNGCNIDSWNVPPFTIVSLLWTSDVQEWHLYRLLRGHVQKLGRVAHQVKMRDTCPIDLTACERLAPIDLTQCATRPFCRRSLRRR